MFDQEPLLLNFRFEVAFLGWNIDNMSVDSRFQRVSGIGATLTTTSVTEGGQNLFTHKLPERVDYSNLVLERGRLIKSELSKKFEDALVRFDFTTTDILVSLLGEDQTRLCSWMFYRAYPVRWTSGDLSASDPAILIDTMELAYSRMQPMQI